MAMTGMFFAFCCCGIVAFGSKTDRQRHTSRMIGHTTMRVDNQIRAKDEKGQPYHASLFRGDGGSRAEEQVDGYAAVGAEGLSFASLFAAPGGADPESGGARRRDGWTAVARI